MDPCVLLWVIISVVTNCYNYLGSEDEEGSSLVAVISDAHLVHALKYLFTLPVDWKSIIKQRNLDLVTQF